MTAVPELPPAKEPEPPTNVPEYPPTPGPADEPGAEYAPEAAGVLLFESPEPLLPGSADALPAGPPVSLPMLRVLALPDSRSARPPQPASRKHAERSHWTRAVNGRFRPMPKEEHGFWHPPVTSHSRNALSQSVDVGSPAGGWGTGAAALPRTTVRCMQKRTRDGFQLYVGSPNSAYNRVRA